MLGEEVDLTYDHEVSLLLNSSMFFSMLMFEMKLYACEHYDCDE